MTLDNIRLARNLVEIMFNSSSESSEDYSFLELREMFQSVIDSLCDDFFFETDCAEFRIIDEQVIDDIWHSEIIDLIKECYPDLRQLPKFVEIDWDQTAENCKVDGLGHHFSGYDGEEHYTNGYYIFRTN